MQKISYKTLSINKSNSDKEWLLVDAENQILGRIASKLAKTLRGKYKTNFTPHVDCGDYVVVINSSKIVMTGNKMSKRELFSHSGYPGGQQKITPKRMLDKDPTSVLRHAIKGMLPKNKLGAQIMKNCYLYSENEHKHHAQKPRPVNLNDLK